jgi:hypothetical protein
MAVVPSTVKTKGFSGIMWPQIQAVFQKQTQLRPKREPRRCLDS